MAVSRRLRHLVAGVAVAMLLAPTVAAAQDADLETELRDQARQREQAEEDLAEVRAAESVAQRRLREAEAALGQAEADLAAREADLVDARERLAATREVLAAAEQRAEDARGRLREAVQDLGQTEEELGEAQHRLEARIRAAFKYGQVTFAEAFTGVRDIADFLNSSTYVGRVMDNDRVLVDQVFTLLELVDERRSAAHELRVETEREAALAAAAAVEAEELTAEVQAAAADARRLAGQVAQRHAEQQVAIEGLREDRASIEGHLAGLDAESDRIEQQLAEIARQQAEEFERRRLEEERRLEEARLEEERRAEQRRLEEERRRAEAEANRPPDGQADQPEPEPESQPEPAPQPPVAAPTDGSWARPVPGHVTSPFGPRWGRNHNGVDLAGPMGTNVVASRQGFVVHVTSGCHPTNSWGCGGGFGNYVTVVHEGGMATVYAHLSGVTVTVGQDVVAGQSLGQVGNSGNSYGSHLHFEVREGGAPRNPCNYIAC